MIIFNGGVCMAYNSVGFNITLDEKCDILGQAFRLLGTKYDYDSESTVKEIMTNSKLDYLFSNVH